MRLSTVLRFAFFACLLCFFGVVSAASDSGYHLVPSSAGGYTLETLAGKRFEYDGHIGFYQAEVAGSGTHVLYFAPGRAILVERDGSVFSYEGKQVFSHLWRTEDGSTLFFHEDAVTGEKGDVLLRADGTLFPYNGRTHFESVYPGNDGSIGLRLSNTVTDDMEILIEADGTLFSHNGRSAFFMIHRYADGSTVLNYAHDFERNFDQYALVEKNGTLFSYRGLTLFPQQIWRSADGSTTITTNHGYILAEKDGTLFSYGGRSEFLLLRRQIDGSTTLDTDPAADPMKVRAQVIVLRDGSLFSYRGQTHFHFIDRWDNGETHIYEPLLRLRTTIFLDGTTATTRFN